MGRQTHIAIKEWAKQCLDWESAGGDASSADKHLQGCAGSRGHLMKGDAKALDTEELKSKVGATEAPRFRLCFLDKPKVLIFLYHYQLIYCLLKHFSVLLSTIHD